jgi:hypothetical protein
MLTVLWFVFPPFKGSDLMLSYCLSKENGTLTFKSMVPFGMQKLSWESWLASN